MDARTDTHTDARTNTRADEHTDIDVVRDKASLIGATLAALRAKSINTRE